MSGGPTITATILVDDQASPAMKQMVAHNALRTKPQARIAALIPESCTGPATILLATLFASTSCLCCSDESGPLDAPGVVGVGINSW